jgi:radical SAM superfamily enzyme YgiQ (UPF0313 family)
VRGEFERAILALLRGVGPAAVEGLCHLDPAGRPTENPPGPRLTGAELDAIPFVSRFLREHVDLRWYKTPSEPYPFLDMMTGRGCAWGRCTFCLWVWSFLPGPSYVARSVGHVVEEFAYIRREMPEVRSVMLQDDTLPPERAAALAEALVRAGNRLPWSCYMRAQCPAEVLVAMRRAGCRTLHVGYETSTAGVLKSIRKGITADIAERFTRDAQRAGLHLHGDFLVGLPGETEASIREMIAWSCRLRPDTAQYQVFIPYPGTPVHAELSRRGWLDADGAPDYPGLSHRRLRDLSAHGYRRFYLSREYLLECLRHPVERVFRRWDTYAAAARSVLLQPLLEHLRGAREEVR